MVASIGLVMMIQLINFLPSYFGVITKFCNSSLTRNLFPPQTSLATFAKLRTPAHSAFPQLKPTLHFNLTHLIIF
jgi:hypothetical protein